MGKSSTDSWQTEASLLKPLRSSQTTLFEEIYDLSFKSRFIITHQSLGTRDIPIGIIERLDLILLLHLFQQLCRGGIEIKVPILIGNLR